MSHGDVLDNMVLYLASGIHVHFSIHVIARSKATVGFIIFTIVYTQMMRVQVMMRLREAIF